MGDSILTAASAALEKISKASSLNAEQPKDVGTAIGYLFTGIWVSYVLLNPILLNQARPLYSTLVYCLTTPITLLLVLAMEYVLAWSANTGRGLITPLVLVLAFGLCLGLTTTHLHIHYNFGDPATISQAVSHPVDYFVGKTLGNRDALIQWVVIWLGFCIYLLRVLGRPLSGGLNAYLGKASRRLSPTSPPSDKGPGTQTTIL